MFPTWSLEGGLVWLVQMPGQTEGWDVLTSGKPWTPSTGVDLPDIHVGDPEGHAASDAMASRAVLRALREVERTHGADRLSVLAAVRAALDRSEPPAATPHRCRAWLELASPDSGFAWLDFECQADPRSVGTFELPGYGALPAALGEREDLARSWSWDAGRGCWSSCTAAQAALALAPAAPGWVRGDPLGAAPWGARGYLDVRGRLVAPPAGEEW